MELKKLRPSELVRQFSADMEYLNAEGEYSKYNPSYYADALSRYASALQAYETAFATAVQTEINARSQLNARSASKDAG